MCRKCFRKSVQRRSPSNAAIVRFGPASRVLSGTLLDGAWGSWWLFWCAFFFPPSPWAPLGAVLAPSSTSWAVFPTVSGRSWVLLEHLGCVESRCEREMRIVRFTIVKPMILRMREPSKRVLRGLLDASVAIPAHLSKRDRLFATFARSLAPLGSLLAASWSVLGRLKIVLGCLGSVLGASWRPLGCVGPC